MKERALKFDPVSLRFTGVIGTGGIGSGKLFMLNGDHTLGREESRSGHFLNVRDYCKQHIILHYIKVLMGPSFSVIPVGKIGDDDTGHVLYKEMSSTGFLMSLVEIVPDTSTLFSFCFCYPDGSGGNMTTDNSASAQVEIKKLGSKGIILAAPEAPLDARQKILQLGKRNGLFCSASFTTGEMRNALDNGLIANTDLISINMEEASVIAGSYADRADSISIVESAVQHLQIHNKNIMIAITDGKRGSWSWDGNQLKNFPAVLTNVVNTAGAGDAFFSGIICGLTLGLDLFDSQQIASLIAGLSVSSPDTIHKGVDRHSLNRFMKTSELVFSDPVLKILAKD
jgi:ribokinase